MRLKLSVTAGGPQAEDVMINVDPAATVGELARTVQDRDPRDRPTHPTPTLSVAEGGVSPTPLDASQLVGECGLRSGSVVAVVPAPMQTIERSANAATLTVLSGPDAGQSFPLRSGTTVIGRDRECPVRLSDPMVSKRHARVEIADVITIIDERSSNGILIDGELVPRAVLRSGDRVVLGETAVSVSLEAGLGHVAPSGGSIEFNRSPRLDPFWEGPTFDAPEPPERPKTSRFPLIASIAPLLMGGVLYAVTKSLASIIFVAMSPIMMGGTWIENKRAAKRALIEATEGFRTALADLVTRLHTAADQERAGRCHEHPSAEEALEGAMHLSPLLWTRRPEHRSFGEVRLGLGAQPSRIEIEQSGGRKGLAELAAELREVVERFAVVDRVPVVGKLSECGSVGLSGPEAGSMDVARGVVVQLAGLHSPAELVITSAASNRSSRNWDWLKWLPHTGSDHSPLDAHHLADSTPTCTNLVAAISDLITRRTGASDAESETESLLPLVVLVVEDDAPVDRSALVQLAENGPEAGVHLIWRSASSDRLPAACRSFLQVDESGEAVATGRVVQGEWVEPVIPGVVSAESAERFARRLAPVVDAGISAESISDLVTSASFLADAGVALADDPRAIIERWRESSSFHTPSEPLPPVERDYSLRALVGRGVSDPLTLDLRSQGPHALVGGTTGSGKSEFLQTWILGMACAHGPQRVNFLLVDYKGGSAFKDCVDLPHTVGLVTDLSPRLVRRALTSLHAELTLREHLLNRHNAKDLLELERSGSPDTPPALVIVVDEFAALVAEVPEFVDGVVNVAQRGRSLGLHLILATQRPAGVIKDNLRANTNLRVALRMADEMDSEDVIGTSEAAGFDPGIPGRAVAKTGPGRLTAFQAGYVGGRTPRVAPPPAITIESLSFGQPKEWATVQVNVGDAATSITDEGASDIEAVVETIGNASDDLHLPEPRRPWMPELAPLYNLARLPDNRSDHRLVFGVLDDPENQAQPVVAYEPNTDGNMAVFGTGGSGKSTFLRTVAISAGLTPRGGPCHVYGLDFASKGLRPLETLPHVGSIVDGDDRERVSRLIREMRQVADERAVRYANAGAGTIDEYRSKAAAPDEPRILLLVDGIGAFRQEYEVGPDAAVFDRLMSVAADGRGVGMHVVVAGDRPAAVPPALAATIRRRLVLRLTSDMDLVLLGAPADGFTDESPPGRGFLGSSEVQVAIIGTQADLAAESREIGELARSMQRQHVIEAAPVERLAEDIPLSTLEQPRDGAVAIGVGDLDLQPVALQLAGPLLIAGPAGSGRTTALATIALAQRAVNPSTKLICFAYGGDDLDQRVPWDGYTVGEDEVASAADELTVRLTGADAEELVVFISGLGDFLNTAADFSLQELLKACRKHGTAVVAEGETSTLGGSWPLLQPIKSARRGVLLQPDQMDGDSLLGTSLPRVNRAEFPPGRGFLIERGRAVRLQVASSAEWLGGVVPIPELLVDT